MQRLSPVFLVEWKEIITFRLMQTCYAEWLKWKWFIITKHTFLIFQPYQTILNINFVSIIQDERLVLPVCMTTLIKLNFKEHESSDARHIQCPITDTITVVLLMAWIAIMMMTIIMMKDWMAKCDISGQLGSAPPGRACNQMQIVQHSSMRCHHHHHHHHYHQNHKCNWQLISKVSIPAFQRPTLAVDPLLSLRLWWSDSFRRIGGKYEGNASSKDVGI